MFLYINTKPNGIVFADIANPDTKLSMTTERSLSKSNGLSRAITRTNTLITHIDSDVGTCTDGCGPVATFPRSTRIVTSGLTTKASDVVADLKFMVSVLEKNPSYFEGFNLNQSSQLVYPAVEA